MTAAWMRPDDRRGCAPGPASAWLDHAESVPSSPRLVPGRPRQALIFFGGLSLRLCAVAAGLLLFGGCGGGDGGGDGRAEGPDPALLGQDDGPGEARAGRAQVLVAALGDSISAGAPLWDPNPANRRRLGPDLVRESQYEYWAERRLPQARFRNCGVSGERTYEIARRLDDCAQDADALVVQGGINDIAQGRPVDAIAANLAAIVRRGRARGLAVAIAEVLPWNNGYPSAAPAIRRLNDRIRRIGKRERVTVYPFFEALEDPERPDRMREEWTIDGDHPSVAGYRRLGRVVEVPPRRR
jgi:lysophospholipase L1-like esterase